jgi:hypothetical protein
MQKIREDFGFAQVVTGGNHEWDLQAVVEIL